MTEEPEEFNEPWRAQWDATVASWLRAYRKRMVLDDAQHFGEGAYEHYAFSYPSFRRIAELESNAVYPIRVCHHTSDRFGAVAHLGAMLGDAAALAERAQLIFTWRHDSGPELEQFVYAKLTEMARQVNAGPGTGWFRTNPAELIGLFESATGLRAPDIHRERSYAVRHGGKR